MTPLGRRSFLKSIALAGGLTPLLGRAEPPAPPDLGARICGMLYGTALGDALGGPIEFQDPDLIQKLPDPPHRWGSSEVLDADARRAAASRLRLRAYDPLRPATESYGQWNPHSPAGTVTDDTRHKLILLHALHAADQSDRWPVGPRELAQAFLDWPATPRIRDRKDYRALSEDWLEEWQLPSRWILGERDEAKALPPERMWQGLPTCCGQMTSLPLAAIFAGRPDDAYRAAWRIGFFDNGWGKDLNAAIVAGLSTALVVPVDSRSPRAAWERVLASMRGTDPFGYSRIRWTQRSVDRWLNFALKSARDADGHPSRMFAAWDVAFRENAKWEAQIPLVVMVGCMALAEYDPNAGLQLTQEWGWDTDSYAQMLGAFLGALHGPTLFPSEWLVTVRSRLAADFGTDLDAECEFLSRLQRLSSHRVLIGA